ncbi:hypothetical protein Tco_0344791 [Tanacetum coccineum]
MSGDAAGSKHTASNTELEFEIKIIPNMSDTMTAIEKRATMHYALSGRYLSTYFVVSDAKCRSQFSASKGRRDIFSKKIAMKPNKEEYRVIKDDNFMLEFDGSMTFRKVYVKADGFVRYPLKLVDLDAIEPADNKYLIDVAGYVSNVGRTNHLKSGSKNLDFHLANHRAVNQSNAMGKPRGDKVYLSSTSSTMILDDVEIPAIKALKDANSGMELKNPYMLIDLTRPVKGTIDNLLMWAQNKKNNVHSFISSVVWYRLELDVSDDTTQTVIVMFDETTTALVGCSAGSLIDIKDEEGGDDSVGSSTLDALADVQPPRLNRLVHAPSVATPSKPSEPKRTKSLVIEDSNVEASGDSSRYVGKNVADPLSDNNKRKRELIDVSTDDVSGNTPLDGSTDRAGSRSDKKKGSWYIDHSMAEKMDKRAWSFMAKFSGCLNETSQAGCPNTKDYQVKFRPNLYSEMTGGSSNDPMVKPSLSTMLHKSLLIASKTIVGQDGIVHSYCGLKLSDIPATSSETFEKVDESTVAGLIQMLDRSNTLAKSFRMAKEWCRSHHSQDFSLRLLSERTSSRQYNTPMMSEVAALIVNDFGKLTNILPSFFSCVCDRVLKTGTTPRTYPLMAGGTLQVHDT